MSEKSSYLGIASANNPLTLAANSGIHQLVQNMRRYDVDQISGIHSAPSLLRDGEVGRIVHPVLGAEGKTYAGFSYTHRDLSIRAQRLGHGRVWNRGRSKGRLDELRVALSMDAESRPDYIGIAAHRPEDISPEDEAKVREALEGSLGFAALHAELGVVQEDGTRKMVMFGEDGAGKLEELPFTDIAAHILMEQVGMALQKDLRLHLGL